MLFHSAIGHTQHDIVMDMRSVSSQFCILRCAMTDIQAELTSIRLLHGHSHHCTIYDRKQPALSRIAVLIIFHVRP